MRFDAITIPALAIVASASFTSAAASAASVSCKSLATLTLPDTTISIAAVVPAGTFDPPGATPPIDTAACRVAGSIKPTSDSNIQFEVWMPLASWNGKFLSAGEGGRFRLARQTSSGRAFQGHHHRFLRGSDPALVFQLMLERGTAGSDGSP